VVEKDLNDAEKASQVVGTKKEPCSTGAISSGLDDGEPGEILSLGFLTQSTQATKLKSNFHSFQNCP